MSTLFIDIGNSYIKAAVKDGADWNICFRDKLSGEAEFYEWLDARDEQKIVVCSVVRGMTQILDQKYIGRNLKMIGVDSIPERLMDYHTPQTLGVDRFLVCHGAMRFSENHVVVIDAGSACTIDIMTADSVYRGGVIMPGMALLREVMSEKLSFLPDAGYRMPVIWPGKSTTESIQWGTAGMFLVAIQGFLHKYRDTFGPFNLFITGGGAHLISELLNGELKIINHPYLIFEGMESFETEYLRD